jgi:large subunit ribosomal protein L10
MAKAVNAGLVDTLAKDLKDCESCVLIGFTGMTVLETVSLRSKLRAQNFRMRVVKNTVASVAFDKGRMKGLGARLSGPSAVVYGGEGALAISRLVVAEVAANKKLKIHGGYADGEVLDAKGIDTLSKVPSRHELLALCLTAFFGPVSELSRGFEGLFTEMSGLIEALEKTKQPEAEATGS